MDIKELLKKYGLELAEDKVKEFDKEFRETWKHNSELEAKDKALELRGKELEAAKGKIKERDAQFEALKNSTGDIEALKKQIADLQADNTEKDKQHAAEVKALKINAAVDAALSAANAKNQKAVRALLDLEKAELADDGTVKGLDEQIKKLVGAEDSKFLFDTEKKKTVVKGASPAETGTEDPDTKVDITKMTYEELAAYMEANPDAKF